MWVALKRIFGRIHALSEHFLRIMCKQDCFSYFTDGSTFPASPLVETSHFPVGNCRLLIAVFGDTFKVMNSRNLNGMSITFG